LVPAEPLGIYWWLGELLTPDPFPEGSYSIPVSMASCRFGEALAQVAQGGGGVTIPGGVQETFRCCTKRHGLVGKYWWWMGCWTG